MRQIEDDEVTVRQFTSWLCNAMREEGFTPWRISCGGFVLGDVTVMVRDLPKGVLIKAESKIYMCAGWDLLNTVRQVLAFFPQKED